MLSVTQWGFAGQAAACEGDKILFQEKFTSRDPIWGRPSDRVKIGDGKAIIRPAVNMSQWQLESGFAFEDADICVTVTLLETADPARGAGGLIFWAKDNSNYYVLNIASNGYYQVNRFMSGRWAPDVIPWTESDVIKKGPNQPNVLRVTLRGQMVTVGINGKEITRFRAQAPEGPSLTGIFAASAPEKPDAWQFTDLKVTNVKPESGSREAAVPEG
jgi:hypothetical protein